jgi:hypothetical protein
MSVAREQSDCSLAKTNSIICITVLSGNRRMPCRLRPRGTIGRMNQEK